MIGIKRGRDSVLHHIPNSFSFRNPYTVEGV